MSDIQHLASNAHEDHYIAFIDSGSRDRSKYPSSSEFVIEFTTPFTNVFSVDVVDVNVPLTSYSIDGMTNHEFAYRGTDIDPNCIEPNGKPKTYPYSWHVLKFPAGNYTDAKQLCEVFNAVMENDWSARKASCAPEVYMRTFETYYRTPAFADQVGAVNQVNIGDDSARNITGNIFTNTNVSIPLSVYTPASYITTTPTLSADISMMTKHATLLSASPETITDTNNREPLRYQTHFQSSLLDYTRFHTDYAVGRIPSDFTNQVFLFSNKPFEINQELTSCKKVIGIDSARDVLRSKTLEELRTEQDPRIRRLVDLLLHLPYREKTAAIVSDSSLMKSHFIFPGNVVDLNRTRYVHMRCPEIELHMYRNRAYENYNIGLAIATAAPDMRGTSLNLLNLPARRFHPISKLTRMTIRLEGSDKKLIDFNGAEVLITLVIRFYKMGGSSIESSRIANPSYNPNDFQWMNDNLYKDGDDDESDDFFPVSHNNIPSYSFDKIQKVLRPTYK